jgi:hypothetical protein
MGTKVHYSGKFGELERIEEFEDRVLDMALDLGADAQIFRGFPTTSPTRAVRGLIVNLAAGQESLSLLVSPDGWLIPGYRLDVADLHNDTEPPWCSVKTQYGSLEGHILVVEVLDAIRKVFIKTLEVDDEAGYWEHRDIGALAKRFRRNQFLIDSFARGLDKSTMREQSGAAQNAPRRCLCTIGLVSHRWGLNLKFHL